MKHSNSQYSLPILAPNAESMANESRPNMAADANAAIIATGSARVHLAGFISLQNDLKLSDSGVRRGTCMAGGKAAAEAGAVTHEAVRCSA
ncbi:MAG: hypothetical protein ABI600_08485 [Luteolibacter sp.]